jgi:hypothetical protein
MHPSAEFIARWFKGTTGRVYVSSLPNPELKGTGEPGERHIWTRSSERIAAFVTEQNRPGRGVYFAVAAYEPNATSRCKDTVKEILALHIDIDFRGTVESPEEIERVVADLPLSPTLVNHSGHGLHGYWAFKQPPAGTPENKAEIEHLLRRLADHLGGDVAVCHVAAIMRMPGTTNSKNGDKLEVRILVERPEALYTIEELKTWLESATPIIHRKGEAGNGSSPDCPFIAFANELIGKPPVDIDQAFAEMVYLGPGGGGNANLTLRDCTAAMIARGDPPKSRSPAGSRNCAWPPSAQALPSIRGVRGRRSNDWSMAPSPKVTGIENPMMKPNRRKPSRLRCSLSISAPGIMNRCPRGNGSSRIACRRSM